MDLTASERYLSRICSETFLSPWSYPRVYRKVSKSEGSSKEICDLLIVYKNKVIIFSDKDCQFRIRQEKLIGDGGIKRQFVSLFLRREGQKNG